MNHSIMFRARFRLMLGKKLNIASKEYRFKFGAYDVVITSQLPDANICDSEWIVMNARGFESECQAKIFAEKLKLACEISSASARLGINTGIDLPTTDVGESIRKQALDQSGIRLRKNIHGIDVFPDHPNIRFPLISATGTVLVSPNPFLSDLSHLCNDIENPSQLTRDIVLLLNYALLRTEPVAQIIFSISAVEMLGQNEEWSVKQRVLIGELATIAQKSTLCTTTECEEVAFSIKRGLYKLSLRQGVLRLLKTLNLDHLKPAWDDLYAQRSTLVHGLAPQPGVDYAPLAFRAISICGQILLKAVSREVKGANDHIDKFYTL